MAFPDTGAQLVTGLMIYLTISLALHLSPINLNNKHINMRAGRGAGAALLAQRGEIGLALGFGLSLLVAVIGNRILPALLYQERWCCYKFLLKKKKRKNKAKLGQHKKKRARA